MQKEQWNGKNELLILNQNFMHKLVFTITFIILSAIAQAQVIDPNIWKYDSTEMSNKTVAVTFSTDSFVNDSSIIQIMQFDSRGRLSSHQYMNVFSIGLSLVIAHDTNVRVDFHYINDSSYSDTSYGFIYECFSFPYMNRASTDTVYVRSTSGKLLHINILNKESIEYIVFYSYENNNLKSIIYYDKRRNKEMGRVSIRYLIR